VAVIQLNCRYNARKYDGRQAACNRRLVYLLTSVLTTPE